MIGCREGADGGQMVGDGGGEREKGVGHQPTVTLPNHQITPFDARSLNN
jgi:hypothetical protein